MNNKETLKALAVEIRIFKKSRKKSSEDYGKYNIDAIPLMSDEARHRSILQALKNRKITQNHIESLSDNSEFAGFLKGLGIETKLRYGTPFPSKQRILKYMDSEVDENRNGANT